MCDKQNQSIFLRPGEGIRAFSSSLKAEILELLKDSEIIKAIRGLMIDFYVEKYSETSEELIKILKS